MDLAEDDLRNSVLLHGASPLSRAHRLLQNQIVDMVNKDCQQALQSFQLRSRHSFAENAYRILKHDGPRLLLARGYRLSTHRSRI